jgi:hypothetical protein
MFDLDQEDDENGRSPTPSLAASTNIRPLGRKQEKERMYKEKGGEYKEAI